MTTNRGHEKDSSLQDSKGFEGIEAVEKNIFKEGIDGRKYISIDQLPKQLNKGIGHCYCTTWVGQLDEKGHIIPESVRHAICSLHHGIDLFQCQSQ